MFVLKKRQLIFVFLLANLVVYPSQDKQGMLLATAGVVGAAVFNIYRVCKIEAKRKKDVENYACLNIISKNFVLFF